MSEYSPGKNGVIIAPIHGVDESVKKCWCHVAFNFLYFSTGTFEEVCFLKGWLVKTSLQLFGLLWPILDLLFPRSYQNYQSGHLGSASHSVGLFLIRDEETGQSAETSLTHVSFPRKPLFHSMVFHYARSESVKQHRIHRRSSLAPAKSRLCFMAYFPSLSKFSFSVGLIYFVCCLIFLPLLSLSQSGVIYI